MRRFNRTPCYSGPDDPEMGQLRGVLELGETVIIETVGGADNDFEAAGETKAGMITSGESHRPLFPSRWSFRGLKALRRTSG